MATCGIYKITSPAKKIYVGKSININNRRKSYVSNRNTLQHLIFKSIQQYGFENHKFEILLTCEKSELAKWETYFIVFYDSCKTKHGLNLVGAGYHIPSQLEIFCDLCQKERVLKCFDKTRREHLCRECFIEKHKNELKTQKNYVEIL